MKYFIFILYTLVVSLMSFSVIAESQYENDNALEACIAIASRVVSDDKTIGELREQCASKTQSPVGRRILLEEAASNNPFIISPYRPNYILPFTYAELNEEPYSDELQGYSLDDMEIKFQFSLKYTAIEDVFFDYVDLQVAFTLVSFWQAYNSDISSPFRETNYEPELMLNYNQPWSLLGLSVVNSSIGFSHQSNGQSGSLSRSWNRLVGTVTFEKGNFIWNVKAWWRIPEDEKTLVEGEYSPSGDDNPNIEKYMGYGELSALYKLPYGHNVDILLRNNLRSDNKGAVQLGWSFPLSKHLRGYVEYFNGYGESLIYYNYSIERFGIGVKLTDWL